MSVFTIPVYGAPVEPASSTSTTVPATLEEVLKPFAMFADALNEEVPDTSALGIFADGGMRFGPSGGCNVGHLRKARSLHARTSVATHLTAILSDFRYPVWEQDGENQWLLRQNGRLVGEAYVMESGRIKWHCKKSDWRDTDALTIEQAKAECEASFWKASADELRLGTAPQTSGAA